MNFQLTDAIYIVGELWVFECRLNSVWVSKCQKTCNLYDNLTLIGGAFDLEKSKVLIIKYYRNIGTNFALLFIRLPPGRKWQIIVGDLEK